jgi:hypothetical protein
MKQIMINLRQTKLLLLAVVCCFVPIFSVFGTETDLQGIDDQSPFSPNFLSELTAAGGTDKPVPQLESLYQKFKQPVEHPLPANRVCRLARVAQVVRQGSGARPAVNDTRQTIHPSRQCT